MDYDSSSKFISSLAKFLQSLCNGYVEFDNGVEVIGHIYLSVDTGKKIDYILNEKVCKTDENSVTFISNSFHAQPAEKPKPVDKKSKKDQEAENVDQVRETDGAISIEPNSTNTGTVPQNSTRPPQSSSHRQKRPFSPQSKRGPSPGIKKSRNDFQMQGGVIEDSLPAGSSSIDPLRDNAGLPSNSNFPQSYDDGGFNHDTNTSGGDEERDIKPSLDVDVTFVKEEFTPGSHEGDTSYSSYPSQSYPGGGGSVSQFGQSNSRLSYGGAGYDTSMDETTGTGGDQSVVQGDSVHWPPYIHQQSGRRSESSLNLNHTKAMGLKKKNVARVFNRFQTCPKCGIVFKGGIGLNTHKKSCTGKQHLTCTVCFKVLSRYDALAEHLRGIHGIGTKVSCRFCHKVFKYKPQVYQHQLICPKRPMCPDTSTASALTLTKREPLVVPHLTIENPETELIPPDLKPISFSYDINMATSFGSPNSKCELQN